jgi:hypothetical protein
MKKVTIDIPKTPAQKKKWEDRLKELRSSCPAGYTVMIPGQVLNMLGTTELWRIHEHYPEPDLTRIPQDLYDTGYGMCAKRIPKEWGRCLYYKVV